MTFHKASRIGLWLVERGWLDDMQLRRALEAQRASGGRLGTVLLEMKAVDEAQLLEALAAFHSTESVSAEELRQIPPEVLKIVPARVALRLQVVPFRTVGSRVHMAAKDPGSIPVLDELSFVTGKRVQMFAASELRIEEALARHYAKALSPRLRQALERANLPGATLPARGKQRVSTEPVNPVADPAPPTDFSASPIVPEIRRGGARVRVTSGKSPKDAHPTAEARPVQGTPPAPPASPIASAPSSPPSLAEAPGLPAAAPAALPPPPPSLPKRLVVNLKPEERARLRTDEVPAQEAARDTRNERDRVAQGLLEELGKSLHQVLLFRLKGDQLEGWMGPESLRVPIQEFRVPLQELPAFLGLREGSRFYLGALAPASTYRKLVALWGGGSHSMPKDCIVLPLRIGDRLAAMVYGDRGSEGVSGLPLADLERVVGAAGKALESAIARGKRNAS